MAVATTISNVTVLVVLLTDKSLMNTQAVYRISLAVSDFFVGIIIFPTYILTNFIYLTEDVSLQINRWEAYYFAVGFFMVLSFHVSVLTLAAAAIDRFKAIYKPLEYDHIHSFHLAKKTCFGLWIISILLAISPFGFIDEHFVYEVVDGTFVFTVYSKNPDLLLSYVVLILIIPVLIMWIFTILTFVFYKKHSKERQKLIMNKIQKLKMNKQIRLLVTLSIMVCVFSVCVLPPVVIFLGLTSNIITYRPAINVCSAFFLTSNSLWNFFIYSFRDKRFRKTSKNLYKKLLCCSNFNQG